MHLEYDASLIYRKTLKNMKARIRDLKGKYYGTIVEVYEDNDLVLEIPIWLSTGFPPSDRQLESWNFTKQQWNENTKVSNGFGGISNIRDLDLTCDSHYESQKSYEIALKIVEALNDN